MARQKDELEKVRKEPEPLTEFKPHTFLKNYDADNADGNTDSEEEDEDDDVNVTAAGGDDGWNDVTEDRQTKRTNKRIEDKTLRYNKIQEQKVQKRKLKVAAAEPVPVEEPKPETLTETKVEAKVDGEKEAKVDGETEAKVEGVTESKTEEEKRLEAEVYDKDSESESDTIDDEEAGGEWVTSENLYKHITNGNIADIVNRDGGEDDTVVVGGDDEEQEESRKIKEKEMNKKYEFIKEGSPEHVVFLTSDFAMQNVII